MCKAILHACVRRCTFFGRGSSIHPSILENAVNEQHYFHDQAQSNECIAARIRSKSSSCTRLATCITQGESHHPTLPFPSQQSRRTTDRIERRESLFDFQFCVHSWAPWEPSRSTRIDPNCQMLALGFAAQSPGLWLQGDGEMVTSWGRKQPVSAD